VVVVQVGIIGKPNAGKSTFFSAATLTMVPIANYPFTTVKPNHGISYLRAKCVCKDLELEDNPKNSRCIDGERFIPVDLVDLPGLVPGAAEGKGLGNQFLDEVRRADALIHVVDASGSTDSEGKLVPTGSHDPEIDVVFLEKELETWMYHVMAKDWEKTVRRPNVSLDEIISALADRLSGLGVRKPDIEDSLKIAGLAGKPLDWQKGDLIRLAGFLRKKAKPVLLAANKIDIPSASNNFQNLKRVDPLTIPVSAEAELALRRATEKGMIHYKPGDSAFSTQDTFAVTPEQKAALAVISEKVLSRFGTTGVQECINSAFFRLLDMIVVFPVEDPEHFTDHSGNVLPDALLVPKGTTLRELAFRIHSELGEGLLYGVNARNSMRLGESYLLKNGDVVSLVSTSQRR
jgi:ribosome-binding ATPase